MASRHRGLDGGAPPPKEGRSCGLCGPATAPERLPRASRGGSYGVGRRKLPGTQRHRMPLQRHRSPPSPTEPLTAYKRGRQRGLPGPKQPFRRAVLLSPFERTSAPLPWLLKTSVKCYVNFRPSPPGRCVSWTVHRSYRNIIARVLLAHPAPLGVVLRVSIYHKMLWFVSRAF